jgi:hypothetical protein
MTSLDGMATWDELRQVLAGLHEERPGILMLSPDLSGGDVDGPPYRIDLAPWAQDAACELWRRFGDQVDLRVGVLPYPPGRRPDRDAPPPSGPPERPAPLDSAQAEAELDGPAVVRSGHTLNHGLLVRDRSGAGLAIATNGTITASVVDPATGEVVGGFVGWQTLPGVVFRVPPGGTERIPLLIGTASTDERLGYVVPPGDWGVQATLSFLASADAPLSRERVRRRTPVLPLTITA